MARLESTAVAGYYPTPSSVIPTIARFLTASATSRGHFSYLDPCAGEGGALLSLLEILHPAKGEGLPSHHTGRDIFAYTIELEKGRHAALKEKLKDRLWRSDSLALHGDAFRAYWKSESSAGVGLLWLNPPYDIDPVVGRLEEKFLRRFAPTLASGGVLVFLVPYHALKASAATLATQFERVTCYRFPEAEFAAYKQVVLFATKRGTDLLHPDPALEAEIRAWAADMNQIPVLPDTSDDTITIPSHETYKAALDGWVIKPVDYQGLLSQLTPWSQTDRMGSVSPIPGIMPEGDDLLVRKYPLAMPPRPAHIAAGIAAGVFNGERITPDDAQSELPPILVKGVFDKEFRTVDEKTDKDGNVKGLIQVQQPKLVTTVLDLSTKTYVTIKPVATTSDAKSISDMTMADLLRVYGRGLMDVMLRQCPVQHDPARIEDQIPLPTLARPLYAAQAQTTMAAIKLLGGLKASKRMRKHKACFVLGEIGSGKTSVALATTHAIGFKRTLVMCPPHLLTSWQDQIKAVTPWFRTVVLSDIEDVQALAAMKDDVPTIAIVSRETAKLGHGYTAVSKCGSCGTAAPSAIDHAKKRSRCKHQPLIPVGAFGHAVKALSYDLLQVFPEDIRAHQCVSRGPVFKVLRQWVEAKKENKDAYVAKMWAKLIHRGTLDTVVDCLLETTTSTGLELLTQFVVADPREELVLRVARSLYAQEESHSYDWDPRKVAKRLLLLVKPSAAVDACIADLKALDKERNKDKPTYYQSPANWSSWYRKQAYLWSEGTDVSDYDLSAVRFDLEDPSVIRCGKFAVKDRQNTLDALVASMRHAFKIGAECGAPLYQASPDPRRFPLATYICRNHASLFDFLILDEGHEYATDGSAQERSAHRLTSLGIPTMLLTGTIMNGYAESLFTNMWSLSEDFRREFQRDERSRFVDRFGYRKRLVEDRDKETREVVAYGSMSDRVETSERMIGDAPGVLPLFLLRYLLPMSVTLHKTDLKIDIPPCTEIVKTVEPTQKLANTFQRLQDTLLKQIKADRFEELLAGKLWGALAELPSYLDLATEDVGNTDSGQYVIRYPESVGGAVVTSAEPLPASTLLPKELWMLDQVEAALAEGRNVMVFAWHTKLLPRLARLIHARTGEKCPILNPTKVPTAKRETWINKEVVKKKHRVLVVNPVTIQTGLNNLVYFADEIWMENPACNPVIYRQAVGRVDRIGQQKSTRIHFPLYQNTAQEELHSLLLQKVAVSMSTDGLDAESALQAAGVGDTSGFSSFAVGRQLYDLLMKRQFLAA